MWIALYKKLPIIPYTKFSESHKLEPFTVKLYPEKVSGGGKIYFKKEQFEYITQVLGFPIKKELKVEPDKENRRICIAKL
jgi:hypothetical protein